jgi:2'-hydroxyisoflavone reductase
MQRREFVRGAAMLGMIPLLGLQKPPQSRASGALRILILGGTGFIGPYQVRYAVERGHRVSVFNRGRSQADLPPSVEHLFGDRNDDLEALRGRSWDVVIDNPTTLPVWVRDAASLLRDAVQHYVFISTISVYEDTSMPGLDESAPLARYLGGDPLDESMEGFASDVARLYGPLKAASEREAERWFPGRTTIIRPGLIVGPGDPSDRFTYWPVRISRGGEILAPGTPADPVQVIDARDLAEWTIRMVERKAFGTFNATSQPMPIGEMLGAMLPLADSSARLTFVDAAFLEQSGVQAWSDMPTWVPPTGDTAGFSQLSVERAVGQGLTFRPVAETAADTLAWFRTLPLGRQAQLRAGITAEREAEVLRTWHARSYR